jgi:hypothetical protein
MVMLPQQPSLVSHFHCSGCTFVGRVMTCSLCEACITGVAICLMCHKVVPSLPNNTYFICGAHMVTETNQVPSVPVTRVTVCKECCGT